MASSEQVVKIDVQTKGAAAATKQLSGLGKVVCSLSKAFSKAFAFEKIANYFQSAVASSGKLDKELLVLRLALGKLKAAIGNAIAPLGEVFLPIVQKAVWAATRLVKAVGKVIAALFGQGKAAKDAAKSQSALAKTNETVKRSLAGFDEIDRLDRDAGEETVQTAADSALTPQLQAVVDKILSLLRPLKEIDFSPAVAAFGRLKEAIAPLQQTLFAGLNWAWHNLLVPLAAWTVEDLLPVFLDALAAALGVLNSVIIALQPAANWLIERLRSIGNWISENPELAQKILLAAGAIAIVNGVMGDFNILGGGAIKMLGGFADPVRTVGAALKTLGAVLLLLITNWDGVKLAASKAWEGIRSLWGGAAQWVAANVMTPLKDTVNGIISLLNALIAGVAGGINGIISLLNKLQFTVPDWVPGLGGKELGFSIKPVSTPQIPYLAQGAVLPANNPFLAVLGDQKRGVNVEAPLDTIKQALAEVLAMQENAGETTVNVNFTGNLAQLARVLKPQIDVETRRKGLSLAKGAMF